MGHQFASTQVRADVWLCDVTCRTRTRLVAREGCKIVSVQTPAPDPHTSVLELLARCLVRPRWGSHKGLGELTTGKPCAPRPLAPAACWLCVGRGLVSRSVCMSTRPSTRVASCGRCADAARRVHAHTSHLSCGLVLAACRRGDAARTCPHDPTPLFSVLTLC